MTFVCVLAAGAETPGAQSGSLQHAHQVAPHSSLPTILASDCQFYMPRCLAPPLWAHIHDCDCLPRRQKTDLGYIPPPPVTPSHTHIPGPGNIRFMFIRREGGREEGDHLALTLLDTVQSPQASALPGRGGEVGEQKVLVLAASQERGGGGLRLPHHRGPWTQSTSAPCPLAGSDVNRLPASVLPLHHKYPLS